jgi:hypothetical protein
MTSYAPIDAVFASGLYIDVSARPRLPNPRSSAPPGVEAHQVEVALRDRSGRRVLPGREDHAGRIRRESRHVAHLSVNLYHPELPAGPEGGIERPIGLHERESAAQERPDLHAAPDEDAAVGKKGYRIRPHRLGATERRDDAAAVAEQWIERAVRIEPLDQELDAGAARGDDHPIGLENDVLEAPVRARPDHQAAASERRVEVPVGVVAGEERRLDLRESPRRPAGGDDLPVGLEHESTPMRMTGSDVGPHDTA